MHNNNNIPCELLDRRISLACSVLRSLPGRYAPMRARNWSVSYLVLQIANKSGRNYELWDSKRIFFNYDLCKTRKYSHRRTFSRRNGITLCSKHSQPQVLTLDVCWFMGLLQCILAANIVLLTGDSTHNRVGWSPLNIFDKVALLIRSMLFTSQFNMSV